MAGARFGAIGAVVGFIAGSANTVWGIVDPDGKAKAYNSLEKVVNKGYDKAKEVLSNAGKGLSKGWDSFTSSFDGKTKYA